MSLSYLRDNYHKQAVTHIRESRRFESIYILQEKPRPTQHTPSTLDLCMVPDHTSHVVHVGQPFTSLHESWNKPLYPEEVLTIKNRLAQPSSWVASFFLPCDRPGVGERSFGPVVTQLLQFTGLINTNMWSVRSILTRGGQPISP
jgi:hypothetical protein